MIAITAQEVTPAIMALFDLTKPTMPRAFNVLEGVNQGQILVDDPSEPTWAAVRETTFGTLYLGGRLSASLLARLVTHFHQLGGVGIGCWLDDPMNALLPPQPDYDGRTLYFPDRSASVALPSLIRQLPSGYTCVPRDQRWLTQSFDYEATLAAFGTVENVLRYTLGVVVLQGDVVVCEAATGAPTHGRIEVGVTTAEPERCRGLATTACATLIAQCEAHGYATWWDCVKQNQPSTRLAHKLGYHNEQEYRYVWWEQT